MGVNSTDGLVKVVFFVVGEDALVNVHDVTGPLFIWLWFANLLFYDSKK